MTDIRIYECKDMINTLKVNAKGIPTRKDITVIKNVKLDSFLFVMDEIIKLLDTKITEIEITEHHTFAKPEDVSNIDFPNSETEIWNGPNGQIIQPKGTFEKIFNDPDEDQEDKLF